MEQELDMTTQMEEQVAIETQENTSSDQPKEGDFELIAKTFMGLEPILAKELRQLGARCVVEGRRVVTFWGDKEMMYRANFQLHTAIRILKPIKHFKATSADDVYNEVMKVDWEQYLSLKTTFAVDSVVFSDEFTHSKFVAYKVKDAIADQFRERTGQRPNVSVTNPDIRLHIHIADKDATLCLDSSGTSLHQRGYRQESVAAPLNEVLAAGMILMSGWKGDTDFIDPMCGSGTLLIEAALIARNMAPGVFRKEYAFEKWPDFDQELFDDIYNDDSQEREFNHHIYGYDIDIKAVNTARQNVRAAGLTKDITVEQQDFKDFQKPEQPAIIISNPPYGERISTPNLLATYKMIGEVLKHRFAGNEAWILSYREECFEQIGLKPSIKIPLYNGSLECEYRRYQMFEGKMKVFREEGNILKTDEEKRAMAEKHRFKKSRDFKKRINDDQQNEDADIRSFTFRKHYPAFDENLFRPKREERGERREERDYSGGERRDNFDRDFKRRRDGWKRDFNGRDDDRRGGFKGKGGGNKGGKGGRPFNRRNGASIIALLIMMLFNLNTPTNMIAQKQFTLEDLNFGGKNYHNMVPKNQYYTWWGDQLVRLDVDKCYTVDKLTGKETVLMTNDELNLWAGTADSLKVRHFYYASFPYPNEPLVLVQNQQERILVDFQKKQAVWRQSCKDIEEVDEGWCAKSRALAFRSADNLYVRDAEGNTHQLSTDGSREIVYGKSVHRDEFGIYKGTFWSPDGQKLAFYRMDQTMVKDYPQVDIFQREATYEPDKYPMAGETSHKVTVGVYDMLSGKTVYLNAGDPTDRYFTNIAWSPDAKTVYVFELNRDQNDCRLVSYDATTGNRIAEIYRETHAKYVEPQHPIVFLPWDSKKFIMQSQKDGFNHLYLFEERGAKSGERCVEIRQLTKGNFVVMDVLGFDEKNKSIILTANADSPIQQNIYSVNMNGKMKRLDNGRGWHGPTLSASGQWVLDKYQEPDVPRNIEVVNTKTAKTFRLFTADDPWVGYNVPEYSCGSIKAVDGTTDLYYRMVKPVGFDPQKKYPTVVYVYGGPHAHNVDARWHYCSRSWETYMAQKGYLLFILDNRGSENRGRDFEQATFRQLGQIEMQDQMQGVEFLKTLPYVDQDRMGVHGWSFGGFMTISLLTNYPETFKVGVAGGPVIDWKWYEVMYGERYMDTPQSNPEGYEKTSLINKAKDLKGRLLIINGYNDPTVVPQHCLSFLAECIKVGTQPDFFVYPGEGHNMMGHSSVHLHEKITQYFEDFLK